MPSQAYGRACLRRYDYRRETGSERGGKRGIALASRAVSRIGENMSRVGVLGRAAQCEGAACRSFITKEVVVYQVYLYLFVTTAATAALLSGSVC